MFVYNRPWHTQQTVEALQKNKLADQSELIVYSDGPKSEDNADKVADVREYIDSIGDFKSVKIVKRKENMGLADSIISGVTEIIEKYGKVIVLEDDLVTSPFFLKYMNDALEFYGDEDRVISIHAYRYPLNIDNIPETFLLKGAQCWGWATWKRGWELFEEKGEKLLKGLLGKNLITRFDYDGSYRFSKMLKDQIKGKNASWAIRWYASALLYDKLTLYPQKSLVLNIGTDGSGLHKDETDFFSTKLSSIPINVGEIPLKENKGIYFAYCEFFRNLIKNEFNLFKRIKRKFRKIFNKLDF